LFFFICFSPFSRSPPALTLLLRSRAFALLVLVRSLPVKFFVRFPCGDSCSSSFFVFLSSSFFFVVFPAYTHNVSFFFCVSVCVSQVSDLPFFVCLFFFFSLGEVQCLRLPCAPPELWSGSQRSISGLRSVPLLVMGPFLVNFPLSFFTCRE